MNRTLLILPGWSFDGRALEPHLRALGTEYVVPKGFTNWASARASMEQVLDMLSPKDGGRAGRGCRLHLVGWSMGASLAVELLSWYGERIIELDIELRLTLLCYSEAFDRGYIEAIEEGLSKEPERTLKTFHAKCFHGHRDQYRRFRKEVQPALLQRASSALDELCDGLGFLKEPRRGRLKQLLSSMHLSETRLIFFRQDVICPPPGEGWLAILRDIAPMIESKKLPGCHYPFYAHRLESLLR